MTRTMWAVSIQTYDNPLLAIVPYCSRECSHAITNKAQREGKFTYSGAYESEFPELCGNCGQLITFRTERTYLPDHLV